jgi:hypothetical protein
MHIVDDEQRSDRRVTPMRPLGSGLAGTSAALALLDDVQRHRLRRAALHLPLRRPERGLLYFHHGLLGLRSLSFWRLHCMAVQRPMPSAPIILTNFRVSGSLLLPNSRL